MAPSTTLPTTTTAPPITTGLRPVPSDSTNPLEPQVAAELSPSASALDTAKALAADPSVVLSAAFVTKPPLGTPTGVSSNLLAAFPRKGDTYAILTTGNVNSAGQANNSPSTGADIGGGSVRGNTDFDVTVLRIDIRVPAGKNCLVGLDFRFLSDEFPEFVNTRYNDAFIAELDATTWTTSGSVISAPNNFAFDPSGSVISINAAGVTSMTAAHATGTTYDGATPVLTTRTPITPGDHSIYLSIFDQGDPIYDSAVFLDNLQLGTVPNVATDCKPGVTLTNTEVRYAALGDSIASGHGLGTSFSGTSPKDPNNPDAGQRNKNCQRSAGDSAQTKAYPDVIRDYLKSTYATVQYNKIACTGDTTAELFGYQVGLANKFLADSVGIVTLTIGADNYDFTKKSTYELIFDPRTQGAYMSWKASNESAVRSSVSGAFRSLGQGHPERWLIATEYFDPFNSQSVIFDAINSNNFFFHACYAAFDDYSHCADRIREIVEGLNLAISRGVGDYKAMRNAAPASWAKADVVGGVVSLFSGHESAKPNCGHASPGTADTWLQYPAGGPLNPDSPPQAGGDCFHPNATGHNELAQLVLQKMLSLGTF